MNAAIILMLTNNVRGIGRGACNACKIKLPTKKQVIEGTKIIIGTSLFLGFILALFSTALIK